MQNEFYCEMALADGISWLLDSMIGLSSVSCEHATGNMRCPCKGHGEGLSVAPPPEAQHRRCLVIWNSDIEPLYIWRLKGTFTWISGSTSRWIYLYEFQLLRSLLEVVGKAEVSVLVDIATTNVHWDNITAMETSIEEISYVIYYVMHEWWPSWH